MDDLDIFLAKFSKIGELNNIPVENFVIKGNAKVSMEVPLKNRLGKDTNEALVQKSLDDVKNNQEISNEDIDKIDEITNRFIDQTLGKFL